MAQAIYTDDTQAAIQRRRANIQAASQATQQRAAANMPGAAPSAAGITTNDLGSQPSTITRADIQARAAQMGQQAGAANTAGSDVPAAARRATAPGLSTAEVNPADLSRGERAAFARQGATFTDQAPPRVAPTTAPATAGIAEPVTPSVASTATPAAETASFGRRAVSSIGRAAGRGLGVLGVAGDVTGAVQDVRAGDYGHAGTNTGLAALDSAAVAAPTPITVGAAAVGHAADYAFGDNGPLAAVPRWIASKVSPYGAMAEDGAVERQMAADRASLVADRASRGLPVPTQRLYANGGFSDRVSPDASFGVTGDAASTAAAGPSPSVAALPPTRTGYGRMVAGITDPSTGRATGPVATYSDGSGNPNAPGYVPRTMSNAEIAALANGNRISIADPGIGGNISSEANGGVTPELRAAPRAQAGFTPADRGRQLDEIERQGRNYQVEELMRKSQTALARGHMRTAGILAGMASSYQNGTAPRESSTQGALDQAKVREANAAADENISQARRRNNVSNLMDQAISERDPQKRESIYDTILASEGKNSGRVVTLKVRDQSGAVDALGNPVVNELPFDTRTGRFLYNPNQAQQ